MFGDDYLSPLSSAKFVPYEMKTSIIKVHSYLNKNLSGAFYNTYYQEEQYFDNLTQLLIIIENLQDAISFPQKSMEWRTFSKDADKQFVSTGIAGEQDKNKPLATFQVNIVFRHNASWQGCVRWLENGLETEFRSALELIFLMDNVLTDRRAETDDLLVPVGKRYISP